MTLRVLVVDDEPLALQRLAILLRRLPDVEQVGEACGVRQAIERVAELHPDVVLLDVKMRDGDGFEVIEGFDRSGPVPAIIFVTAFDHFAIRAYQVCAVDYLLKPVELGQLGSALSRARRNCMAEESQQQILELKEVISNLRADAHRASDRYVSELWLKRDTGLTRVAVGSINFLSSEDDYVRVHTSTESYLMRGSIRQMEERLNPSEFIRIHRRWLVQKSEITLLKSLPMGRTEVHLRSGEKLVAGRVYGKALRNLAQTP